jgi:colanic acid/amylovoran biosynthesis glycosyltransferase
VEKIKVLQCFYFYLAETMNWAYRIIAEQPDLEQRVAAPIMIENKYFTREFQFLWPFFQTLHPKDEWSISMLQRVVSKLTRPLYWRMVAHKLRADKPQVIHAHFASTACQVMDMAQKLGCPLVVSFYGFDYEKLPNTQPRYRALYQKLFQKAAMFISEGSHGAKLLEGMGCPPEKIRTLRLGRIIQDREPPMAKQKAPKHLSRHFCREKGLYLHPSSIPLGSGQMSWHHIDADRRAGRSFAL